MAIDGEGGIAWGGARDTALRRRLCKLMERAWPGSRVKNLWVAVGAYRSKRAMLDTTSWGGKIYAPDGDCLEFKCWDTMTECSRAGAIAWSLDPRATLSGYIECCPRETNSPKARADVGNGGE